MSTPDSDGVRGTVCTEEQYQNSTNLYPNSLNPTITCLTQGQSVGLTLTTEAAFLSLVAVTFIFVLIGRNVRRYRKAFPNGGWRLLEGPSDIYMFFIFVYDIFLAMGSILSVRWVHNGIVEAGPYCTAQGIVQQVGELGVATVTLILTIHTFVVALWNVGSQARKFAFGIVAVATLFVALWVSIGNVTHKHYVTPTPYWCWIGPGYKTERIAGEYMWFWITLFASVIMNISVYFWTKGHLAVNLQRMLLYPVAYAITILPTTSARWALFDHKKVSSAVTFFCVVVFDLSGVTNVLLFLIIRSELLLFTHPQNYRVPEATAETGRPTTVISNDTAKYNRSSRTTGTDIVDDGEWEPPHVGSSLAVPLSRIESRPEV